MEWAFADLFKYIQNMFEFVNRPVTSNQYPALAGFGRQASNE